MTDFKQYIAKQMIGKRLHFKCDCLFPLDCYGVIKDYEIVNQEIIFIVETKGKFIKLGENHPKLLVE